jgi:hypothetical protein
VNELKTAMETWRKTTDIPTFPDRDALSCVSSGQGLRLVLQLSTSPCVNQK